VATEALASIPGCEVQVRRFRHTVTEAQSSRGHATGVVAGHRLHRLVLTIGDFMGPGTSIGECCLTVAFVLRD
jgi:hypothetical protein